MLSDFIDIGVLCSFSESRTVTYRSVVALSSLWLEPESCHVIRALECHACPFTSGCDYQVIGHPKTAVPWLLIRKSRTIKGERAASQGGNSLGLLPTQPALESQRKGATSDRLCSLLLSCVRWQTR
jgi:hypothetical protein